MNRTIDLRNVPPAGGAVVHRDAGRLRGAQRPLDPHGFAFITCVDDETQYDICLRYVEALQIPSGYAMEKIAVFGATSMAEGYQRAMEASTARYKIYIHQDAYLVHRALLSELVNLFRTYPRLGMVGVTGGTRLPASVLFSMNNPFHSYGREWDYRRPGGPSSLLGPANRRRLHFTRLRSFVGDYLPAVAVDGFFMATQYDIPWIHPQFGFDLYDQVQALEFIKAGLEVGVARQETIWCVHWGPLQEPSREQHRSRQIGLRYKAGVFRQLYPAFVGVPARRLYEQHQGARDFKPSDPERERLGIVIVTFNGREVLLRALRALLQQCEALKEVEYQVVVINNASTDDTAAAVRREFPLVTVIANASNDALARGFNLGLRHLDFPSYVLVMHSDAELTAGTLAGMVSHLREHPSTAGVIGSLTNPDEAVQLQRATMEPVPRRPPRPQRVTLVSTTCALVRGRVFFDVGLYDERFNSYHVDLEWSLRARRKGYSFALLPEARVIHYRSLESRHDRPAFADRLVANLWLLYKHGGRRWATVLYGAQRLLAGWLAFRWRNDGEALRQLSQAMTRAESLYRTFREENRLQQLLAGESSERDIFNASSS